MQKLQSTTVTRTIPPSKQEWRWNATGCLKAKEIKGWERQYPIEIRSQYGDLIPRHKVDFRVRNKDDSFELIETKGLEDFEYKGTDRIAVATGAFGPYLRRC
jgi:hypothetical protein